MNGIEYFGGGNRTIHLTIPLAERVFAVNSPRVNHKLGCVTDVPYRNRSTANKTSSQF